MVVAVIKVKIFEADPTETNREPFVGLGVEFDRLDVSTAHLAHETNKSFHDVGWGLSVVRVQIIEDFLQVVDSD